MVQLAKDDFEWFQTHYGEGKLSWAIGELFAHFRRVHVHVPQDYFEESSKAVSEKIDEGLM